MIHYTLNYIISHRLQLTKFVIIGLVTFCIYFSSFHLFYGIVHLDYRLAALIAYTVTVASHFLLHRSFTFKATEQQLGYNFGKYVFMLLVNYLNVLVIMWFLVDVLKCSPYIGLVAPTATSALISFFMMKYFVFGAKQLA